VGAPRSEKRSPDGAHRSVGSRRHRAVGLSGTLGRRWRKDHPDFWRRLSPLGAGRPSASEDEAQATPAVDPEPEAFIARLQRLREAQLEEARRDVAAFNASEQEADLRLPAINGSMDDRESDVEEE
jgi:hypothetical protein